jgi:hypothetical protein
MYSVISRKLWLNAGSRKKRSKNASLALDFSMYKQFGTGFVTVEWNTYENRYFTVETCRRKS